MSRLALVLLAAVASAPLAGCDSTSDGLLSLDSGVLVSLAPDTLAASQGRAVLLLQAERDVGGCLPSLATEVRSRAGRLDVVVLGVASSVTGGGCPDIYTGPPKTAALLPAFVDGGLEIRIRHRGATDLYAVRFGREGEAFLEAVRTRTTRPAGE